MGENAVGELLFRGQPVDRDAANSFGVTSEQLRMLVRRGELRQVLRGVYVDPRAGDDLELRARCLELVLPCGAAVSRLTAAWLLGIDGRGPSERGLPLEVECTVPRGMEPMSRPGIRCYAAPLGSDVDVVNGVRCTTAERTAVDVLRWRPPHLALAVVDAMAHRGLVAADALPAAVERFRGSRGAGQARYLAAHVESRSESFGESWARLRVLDARFPRPEAQVAVLNDERELYRLDLAWRRRRVALEYDGEEFHSSPEQRAHDTQRRDDLEQRFGWTVLVVGKGDVLGRSLRLERAVGEALGLAPQIIRRRW
jgi:very-short-patch-repair endonuclease